MAWEGERGLAPEGGAPPGLGGRVGSLDQSFQKLPGPAARLHFLLTGGLPGAWMDILRPPPWFHSVKLKFPPRDWP